MAPRFENADANRDPTSRGAPGQILGSFDDIPVSILLLIVTDRTRESPFVTLHRKRARTITTSVSVGIIEAAFLEWYETRLCAPHEATRRVTRCERGGEAEHALADPPRHVELWHRRGGRRAGGPVSLVAGPAPGRHAAGAALARPRGHGLGLARRARARALRDQSGAARDRRRQRRPRRSGKPAQTASSGSGRSGC